MIMSDLPAPSWASPSLHFFHPFPFSSQPSNISPPAINSSADPPPPPFLPPSLSPTSHHCGPVSLGSKTWWNGNCFQQLFSPPSSVVFSCSTPLSFPSSKSPQLMELFIKLTKKAPHLDKLRHSWGVSTLSKPAVCLHKKYGVHNMKRVKVSPALQNTDFIWISPTHLSFLLW